MYLKACFPDVNPENVLENMGFKIDITRAEVASEPTSRELSILREQCDPQRLILG
jgi:glutaconate CoA-transferase subunit B